MYRILREHGEVGERRRQATHPPRVSPGPVATGPNQCWSWDITELAGPATWTYYHLYVIIDIYSRYVPGWLLAERETAALAQRLLAETITKQHLAPQPADHPRRPGQQLDGLEAGRDAARGPGVTKSHSRPHTSNDNPYSEAGFKTLKYRPDFPDRFGSVPHPLVLPGLLRLVQPPGPPLRDRAAHPRRPAPRPGPHRARPPRPGPHRRLQRPPRAVHPQAP